MSSVLKVIQKDVMGLKAAVDMTTAGFSRMKLAVAGAAGVFAGTVMLKGMYDLSKHADEYLHQLELMKNQGFSIAEQQDAIRAANKTSSLVMTTTPTGNLEAIRELVGALNSAGASPAAATEEAIANLTSVQRAQAVMQNAMPGGRGGSVMEMVKALEEIGATKDPERFERLITGMVQATEAFGGKLTSQDWLQTLKYARGAGSGYSDVFITKYLPTLMQELKTGRGSGAGGGAGNPLASLFQIVVAGKGLDVAAKKEWDRLGLIKPGALHTDHGRMSISPDGIVGAQDAVKNPFFWMRDVMLPALQKIGIQPGTPAFTQELAVLFGNRVAQQMATLLTNIPKMKGDRELIERAAEAHPAFEELVRRDPIMARQAAESQLDRAKTDLGKNTAVTTLIYKFAAAVQWFSEVIERHPKATEVLLKIGAGLGVALVALGSLAVAAAGLAALGISAGPVLGVALLLAVGAGLAWLADHFHVDEILTRWRESIRAWASSTWTWLSQSAREIGASIARWTHEIGGSAAHDILAIWVSIGAALDTLIHNIAAWFRALPGRIGAALGGAGTGPGGQMAPGMPAPGTPASPMSYQRMPEGAQRPVAVHAAVTTHFSVDGRQFAALMTRHQVAGMQRPQTGATGPDQRSSVAGAFAGAFG